MTELQQLTGTAPALTVDGKTYPLHPFDLTDLAEIDMRWGSVAAMSADSRSFVVLRFLLWRALLPALPELSEEDAGHMVPAPQIDKLEAVLNGFFPQADPDAAEAAPPTGG